jgi:hypothetical protein
MYYLLLWSILFEFDQYMEIYIISAFEQQLQPKNN